SYERCGRQPNAARNASAQERQTPRPEESSDMPSATDHIVDFLKQFTTALGIDTPIDVEETADGARLNLSGDQAELLVRHRGEPLKALQHVVDTAFGRNIDGEKRVFVDALGYRKGKDSELRQMAKFLAEKVR